jgi:drug/metabolite transporter (DMT)-like permease
VGIILLLGGIAFIAAGIILSSLPPAAFEDENLTADDSDIDDFSGIPPSIIRGGPIAIGSVMIAIGIVWFIVAYGLLKGMRWAWTVTVVLSIISIVLSMVTTIATVQALLWLGVGMIQLPAAPIDPSPPPPPFGAIISIIISGIIIYHLYRPNVKAYFGKAAARTDATPAA